MSTKFILENSATLGAADELKWFPVPQIVVTVTTAAFQKERKGKKDSIFFPFASFSPNMRREVFFALFSLRSRVQRPPSVSKSEICNSSHPLEVCDLKSMPT